MPDSPRPRRARSADTAHVPAELALIQALLAARDTPEFARVVAAAAVHPDGLGASVAHVLRRDAFTEVFERITRLPAPAPPVTFRDWLDACRGDVDAATPGPAVAPLAWDFDVFDVATCRAWREGRAAMGESLATGLPWAEARGHAALPLRAGGVEYGLVIAEFRDDDVAGAARLRAMWEAVRVALEAHDRALQLDRRTVQAGALLELSEAVMSPRNLVEVLHLATRRAAERTGADAAAIWTVGEDGASTLELSHGPSGARERHGRALVPVVQAALEAGRPRTASPATDEMLLPAAAAAEIAAFSVWPIEAYGRAVGALGVWSVHGGARPLAIARAEREYLGAIANVIGLALEQARRFRELRDAERRERDATRYARRRESLAALGELTADASRAALKPCVSVRAFADRLVRELPEGAARECAEVIVREAERVERILREQQAHADLAPPSLAMVQLNTLAEAALRTHGETLVRRRARVVKRLAADVPELLLDRDGIGNVVQSVLAYALDRVATGGRIRIETRRLAHHVLFELGHDGTHAAGHALDQVFLPFGDARPSAAPAGLSLARRVIQDHGGEVRVRAEGEWTTLITFTLPITGNQDRRHTGADRRRTGDRREVAA